ncbi:extracellular solute-binding protein [Burkholderia stagnalis]|uniref:extracellular solute-binding protein n=1 Tax=Burkholderia stagnalis TaxID=1503054 RepID=UPI0009C10005|nr:extracellular solute-binding protein [Burkholderia stagnalis]
MARAGRSFPHRSRRTGRRAASRIAACIALCVVASARAAITPAAATSPAPRWQTTLSEFGDARPAAALTRFAYADAAPPREGTLTLSNYSEVSTYDSLNPFLLRGNAAPDLLNLAFETLMQRSLDEVGIQYPLLADRVALAPDGLSATFHLDPAARFSNGAPVTADDVRYAFECLTNPATSPVYSSRYALIRDAVVVDAHTVRFEFRRADRRAALTAGDLYVFSRNWGRTRGRGTLRFDQLATVEPLASGPYVIASRASNREIVYRRNPRYWAANLPVRRGMFNFSTIRFRLYSDPYAPLQAFRAGEIDALFEGSAEQWAHNYDGPGFTNGTLYKREFPERGISGAQGLIFNLRRAKFRDVRVREAIGLALDYEWINRNMFYGQYTRSRSYFDDSEFAATGAPGAAELALLEPLRNTVPPAVFGPLPPQPDTSAPHGLRRNLARAEALLASAGWRYRDGVLRDASGAPLTVELLDDGSGMERILMIVVRNLRLLGIDARLRIMDQAVINERLKHFDFDMTTVGYRPASIPGAELARRFGSAAARTPGSENYAGVASPAVDALIDAVQRAQSESELVAATRALDRVLLGEHIMVPEWHITHARIAWNARIAPPSSVPRQYGWADWVIGWWHPQAGTPLRSK